MQINEAQEKISSVENSIFDRVKREVELQVTPLRRLSHALAHLDALFGLACIARDYDWKKPIFMSIAPSQSVVAAIQLLS